MTRLSVVVPTWRESERIGFIVRAARAWADEVIVADGGSRDGTVEIARRHGARVVRAPRCRGAQLSAGASAASGDVLLFQHADVRFSHPPREAILAALGDPAVVGGNFLLRFMPLTLAARAFTWANDLRRRCLHVYYGDSALFVRRDAYEAVGGFRDQPLFEDYDLARRLERYGRTAYIEEVEVRASGRRFARAPLRTLFLWGALQSLYSCGVPASRLAPLYRDVR